MAWYAWAFIIMQGIGVALTIGQVGKERQPITPAVAVLTTIIAGLYVWAVVSLA